MDIKELVNSAVTSLSNNYSIETIMLQAQAIAHLLKDETFISWVRCEQNGYTDGDKLPSYRILNCQVKVDIGQPFMAVINDYSFPPGMLGKYDDRLFHMSFHNPIAEIERFSASNGQLRTEVIAAMYPKMNKFISGNILNARQIVSAANLTSIVTNVKSRLLKFLLKINDELNMNIDLTKLEYKETVSTIMNQTIYAGIVNSGSGNIDVKNSNIIGGRNNKFTMNEELKSILLKLLDNVKSINLTNADEKQDVDESLSTIKEEIDNSNPNPGIIRRALRVIKSIPSVMAAHGIEMVMDQILKMFNEQY